MILPGDLADRIERLTDICERADSVTEVYTSTLVLLARSIETERDPARLKVLLDGQVALLESLGDWHLRARRPVTGPSQGSPWTFGGTVPSCKDGGDHEWTRRKDRNGAYDYCPKCGWGRFAANGKPSDIIGYDPSGHGFLYTQGKVPT